MNQLLRAEKLTLTYANSATALLDVTMEVHPGAIVAILGANGAGKTSLVRALTGQYRFYGATLAGRVTYGEADLSVFDTAAVARSGVVQVPEGRKLFGSLSVMENLECGAASQRGLARRELLARIELVLHLFPQLRNLLRSPAGLLSGGEQQMTAIGRALVANPSVLVCDELSLGLGPIVIRDIYRTLAELNAKDGLSLVVIEQNARQALKMASYVYVLEVGRIVAEGPAERMRHSKELDQYYVGGQRND